MIFCKHCNTPKNSEDFYNRSRKCKECTKAAVRANYRKNREHYREYEKKRAQLPHRIQAREDYAKTAQGRAAGSKAKALWRLRNNKKNRCANKVNHALRAGKIEKPENCANCGHIGRIEGHHPDYDKPLDVQWLCSKCHRDWHIKNGEGLNAGWDQ